MPGLGLHATLVTPSECPSSSDTLSPVAASQMITVLSQDPDAILEPFGGEAQDLQCETRREVVDELGVQILVDKLAYHRSQDQQLHEVDADSHAHHAVRILRGRGE